MREDKHYEIQGFTQPIVGRIAVFRRLRGCHNQKYTAFVRSFRNRGQRLLRCSQPPARPNQPMFRDRRGNREL